jgi:hypothetical protein
MPRFLLLLCIQAVLLDQELDALQKERLDTCFTPRPETSIRVTLRTSQPSSSSTLDLVTFSYRSSNRPLTNSIYLYLPTVDNPFPVAASGTSPKTDTYRCPMLRKVRPRAHVIWLRPAALVLSLCSTCCSISMENAEHCELDLLPAASRSRRRMILSNLPESAGCLTDSLPSHQKDRH